MKLTQILHPEILYGLRGNPEEIHTLKWFQSCVSFCLEGFTYTNLQESETNLRADDCHYQYVGSCTPGKKDISGGQWIQNHFSFGGIVMAMDDHSRGFMALAKKFKVDSGKCYYTNKDFLLALSEIDKEIPLQYLPERFLGYFGFPNRVLKDDTGYVVGAYVFIGDAKETLLRSDLHGHRVLWCVYLNEDESGVMSHSCVTEFRLELDSKKLGDITRDLPSNDFMFRDGVVEEQPTPETIKKRTVIIRALLNAVLYLNSEDPEIQKAVGLANPNFTNSKRKELKRKQEQEGLENLCALPVTFLNYQYHRKYNVDSTTVCGHFRWQRCGVALSRVKLLWIDEHFRNFQKEIIPSYTTPCLSAYCP